MIYNKGKDNTVFVPYCLPLTTAEKIRPRAIATDQPGCGAAAYRHRLGPRSRCGGNAVNRFQ